MRYYVAFSIAGTGRFITAATSNAKLVVASEFKKVPSRRAEYDSFVETKLHWSGLLKADGTPHTNPSWVIRRFNELKKRGWVVDDRKFREYHFSK